MECKVEDICEVDLRFTLAVTYYCRWSAKRSRFPAAYHAAEKATTGIGAAPERWRCGRLGEEIRISGHGRRVVDPDASR